MDDNPYLRVYVGATLVYENKVNPFVDFINDRRALYDLIEKYTKEEDENSLFEIKDEFDNVLWDFDAKELKQRLQSRFFLQEKYDNLWHKKGDTYEIYRFKNVPTKGARILTDKPPLYMAEVKKQNLSPKLTELEMPFVTLSEDVGDEDITEYKMRWIKDENKKELFDYEEKWFKKIWVSESPLKKIYGTIKPAQKQVLNLFRNRRYITGDDPFRMLLLHDTGKGKTFISFMIASAWIMEGEKEEKKTTPAQINMIILDESESDYSFEASSSSETDFESALSDAELLEGDLDVIQQGENTILPSGGGSGENTTAQGDDKAERRVFILTASNAVMITMQTEYLDKSIKEPYRSQIHVMTKTKFFESKDKRGALTKDDLVIIDEAHDKIKAHMELKASKNYYAATLMPDARTMISLEDEENYPKIHEFVQDIYIGVYEKHFYTEAYFDGSDLFLKHNPGNEFINKNRFRLYGPDGFKECKGSRIIALANDDEYNCKITTAKYSDGSDIAEGGGYYAAPFDFAPERIQRVAGYYVEKEGKTYMPYFDSEVRFDDDSTIYIVGRGKNPYKTIKDVSFGISNNPEDPQKKLVSYRPVKFKKKDSKKSDQFDFEPEEVYVVSAAAEENCLVSNVAIPPDVVMSKVEYGHGVIEMTTRMYKTEVDKKDGVWKRFKFSDASEKEGTLLQETDEDAPTYELCCKMNPFCMKLMFEAQNSDPGEQDTYFKSFSLSGPVSKQTVFTFSGRRYTTDDGVIFRLTKGVAETTTETSTGWDVYAELENDFGKFDRKKLRVTRKTELKDEYLSWKDFFSKLESTPALIEKLEGDAKLITDLDTEKIPGILAMTATPITAKDDFAGEQLRKLMQTTQLKGETEHGLVEEDFGVIVHMDYAVENNEGGPPKPKEVDAKIKEKLKVAPDPKDWHYPEAARIDGGEMVFNSENTAEFSYIDVSRVIENDSVGSQHGNPFWFTPPGNIEGAKFKSVVDNIMYQKKDFYPPWYRSAYLKKFQMMTCNGRLMDRYKAVETQAMLWHLLEVYADTVGGDIHEKPNKLQYKIATKLNGKSEKSIVYIGRTNKTKNTIIANDLEYTLKDTEDESGGKVQKPIHVPVLDTYKDCIVKKTEKKVTITIDRKTHEYGVKNNKFVVNGKETDQVKIKEVTFRLPTESVVIDDVEEIIGEMFQSAIEKEEFRVFNMNKIGKRDPKEFMKELNEFLYEEKPGIVLYGPKDITGLDLKNTHRVYLCGWFWSEADQHQATARALRTGSKATEVEVISFEWKEVLKGNDKMINFMEKTEKFNKVFLDMKRRLVNVACHNMFYDQRLEAKEKNLKVFGYNSEWQVGIDYNTVHEPMEIILDLIDAYKTDYDAFAKNYDEDNMVNEVLENSKKGMAKNIADDKKNNIDKEELTNLLEAEIKLLEAIETSEKKALLQDELESVEEDRKVLIREYRKKNSNFAKAVTKYFPDDPAKLDQLLGDLKLVKDMSKDNSIDTDMVIEKWTSGEPATITLITNPHEFNNFSNFIRTFREDPENKDRYDMESMCATAFMNAYEKNEDHGFENKTNYNKAKAKEKANRYEEWLDENREYMDLEELKKWVEGTPLELEVKSQVDAYWDLVFFLYQNSEEPVGDPQGDAIAVGEKEIVIDPRRMQQPVEVSFYGSPMTIPILQGFEQENKVIFPANPFFQNNDQFVLEREGGDYKDPSNTVQISKKRDGLWEMVPIGDGITEFDPVYLEICSEDTLHLNYSIFDTRKEDAVWRALLEDTPHIHPHFAENLYFPWCSGDFPYDEETGFIENADMVFEVTE